MLRSGEILLLHLIELLQTRDRSALLPNGPLLPTTILSLRIGLQASVLRWRFERLLPKVWLRLRQQRLLRNQRLWQ